MVAAEPWPGMVHGYRGRRRGLEGGDEWKHRKPVYLPRDGLLCKPDPAPADDFLFWGSKKSKPVNCLDCLVALWYFSSLGVRNIQFVLFLRARCGSGAKLKSSQRCKTPAKLHSSFITWGNEPYTITITGGMGHKGRAAARPRTLRGAWID